ncbi:MAG: hypothetical protein FJ270_01720 [Planctomycetes bacterium]|nr:hypothetical protein [Planctomycetota bacterium]
MIDQPIIRWLLGIEVDPSTRGSVRLGWEMPLAGWMWLVGISAAVALAWLAYTRMTPRPWVRRSLTVLRAATLLLLLVLVARPILEFVEERRESDRIIMLADRSKSLQLADWKDGTGTLRTRDEQLRSSLEAIQLGGRPAEWFAFSGDVALITPSEPGPANGRTTDLPLAIDRALRRSGGGPIGGLVLVTDGRSTRPIDARLIRSLTARSVPVYAIALGSRNPLGDAAIMDVQAPAKAFVRDQVPFVVRVQPLRDAPGRLELVNMDTGAVIDRASVPAGEASTHVLVATTDSGDSMDLRVRLVCDAEDAVPTNNEATVTLGIIDRAIRVLMVEGGPRWEYRYVKNILVREPSMESSIMLLSADRDFTQEGNMAVTRIPTAREEFDLYDLFVIGDVASGQFSDAQLEEVRRAVTERGAGLLLIGGERSMPMQWMGSPLDDVFPMRLSSSIPRQAEPVAIEPTPLAKGLGLLRLGDGDDHWPPELGRDGPAWSRLQWMQRIPFEDLKPTAEVLATAFGSTTEPIGAAVLSMRFGSGHVVYVATDETWRWRNGIGEAYQERFWIQLVRYLSRAGLSAASGGAQLSVEPTTITVGQTATIRLDVKDELIQRRLPNAIDAVVSRSMQREDVIRLSTDAATKGSLVVGLAGIWQPRQAGEYDVAVMDAAFGDTLMARVRVIEPDDEFARPETDHATLESLCASTGGRLLSAADLPDLATIIPDRSTFTERIERVPVWSSPLTLILLVVLCGLEWSIRRAVRLA